MDFPKNKRVIIAISGKVKAGKDELANILINQYGFKKVFFADRLKTSLSAAMGIPLEKLESQEGKAEVDPFWQVQRRVLLQAYGQIMRKELPKAVRKLTGKKHLNLEDSIWAEGVRMQLENLKTGLIVITDMRHENEKKICEDLGAWTIRIDASYSPSCAKNLSSNKFIKFFQLLFKPQHISEHGLDGKRSWDFVIKNDSTLSSYTEKCLEVVEDIKHLENQKQFSSPGVIDANV